MIQDKALLPSPTPASKIGENEFLLLLSLIPTMGILFMFFAMLLIDRYYVDSPKLLKSDNEIGGRPKEKNRVSQPKKERLEEFDNAASDKLKESDSEKRESLQKPRDYGTFAPPTDEKHLSFSQSSFFDGTPPLSSAKKIDIEDIDYRSNSDLFPSP